MVEHRHRNVLAGLLALQHLLAQLVALGVYHGLRVYPSTVHHDGEEAIHPAVVASGYGYGLPGLDTCAHLHEVLGVVGVDGLKAVVVANYYGVAVL